MEASIEVIGNTIMYKGKITILAEIRKRFKLKDGDKLFWIINKNGDLAIRKKVDIELKEKKHDSRFKVKTSS